MSRTTVRACLVALILSSTPALGAPPTDILLHSGGAPSHTASVDENRETGAYLGYFTTADLDSGDGHTYSLTFNPDGAFVVDGSALLAARTFNYEVKSVYLIRVRSTDAGGDFLELDFTIVVNDVNDLPVLNAASLWVPAGSPAGTSVGTLSVSDEDGESLSTFILDGNLGDTFSLSPQSHELTVADPRLLDATLVDRFDLHVGMQDSRGGFTSDTVTVSVHGCGPVDGAIPTACILLHAAGSPPSYTVSVDENRRVGTVVGALLTEDLDESSGHTYTLSVPAGDFFLDGATLLTNRVLDYEVRSSYLLGVQSTNANGGVIEQDITIHVRDTNDLPELDVMPLSVLAGSPAGTSVGFLSVTDQEGGSLSTYILGGNVGDTFSLSPQSHELTVADARLLDATLIDRFDLYVGVQDETFGLAFGTVPVFVHACAPIAGDVPTACDQSIATREDTAAGLVLAGVSPTGDLLSFSVVTGPVHGALSGTPPDLTYTPAPDFTGADSFSFLVTDGFGDSVPATVSVTVTPVNTRPIANGQALATQQDTALSLTLTGDDDDGDSLSFTVSEPPAHGALSGDAPNLTYTPDESFVGIDTFGFTVSDAAATSLPALVHVVVTALSPENVAPAADAKAVTTEEDSAVTVTLSGSDPEGSALSFSLASVPQHGSLSGTAPNLTFMPAPDFFGSDSFTYKVNDGAFDSALATVSVTVTPVDDPPVARSLGVSTDEETAVLITLDGDDVDGDTLELSVVTPPSYGSLSGEPAELTYTPDVDFEGLDFLSFQASAGGVDSAPAFVLIVVAGINDAPVAEPLEASTPHATAVLLPLEASDVEGDPLTFAVVTPPANGTVSVDQDEALYTPDDGFEGEDLFTFTASDGELDSLAAEVRITVAAAPPDETPEDAGSGDAGSGDAGSDDAGSDDAGNDTGNDDAGNDDTGSDAGSDDIGGDDAGSDDAGSDAGATEEPVADAGRDDDAGAAVDAGPSHEHDSGRPGNHDGDIDTPAGGCACTSSGDGGTFLLFGAALLPLALLRRRRRR